MDHQVQIRIKGQIDERWSEWLDGLTITHTGENETLLTGRIQDQSALYGLMSKLRDLGLPLAALEVSEEAATSEKDAPCQATDGCSFPPHGGALADGDKRR